MHIFWRYKCTLLLLFLFTSVGLADPADVAVSVVVPMNLVSTSGGDTHVGSLELSDSKYGLLIKPSLRKLPVGLHGFHIHTTPSCAKNGEAAGGHYDPEGTGLHLGPYDPKGHLGDLPVLTINTQGIGNTPVLAPRLTLAMVMNRSIIIDTGGDNYADTPQLNGGGGARLACGVIGEALSITETITIDEILKESQPLE